MVRWRKECSESSQHQARGRLETGRGLQAQELQQKDRRAADAESCARASEGKRMEIRVLRV